MRFGNYRYAQPMNGRVVEANFPRPDMTAIRPSPDAEILRLSLPRSRLRISQPVSDRGIGFGATRSASNVGVEIGTMRSPLNMRVGNDVPSPNTGAATPLGISRIVRYPMRERIIGVGVPVVRTYIARSFAPWLYRFQALHPSRNTHNALNHFKKLYR